MAFSFSIINKFSFQLRYYRTNNNSNYTYADA